MTTLENRHEILFLYEAKDCNPNGDPLDENRPRTDPETGETTVTDVRIKRTIRDYFLQIEPDASKRIEKGTEILIRDTYKKDGFLAQGKDRAESFIDDNVKKKKGIEKLNALQEVVLKSCIDARLFGCAIPLGTKEASLKLTGPVQFMPFNRSLHRVSPQMVQQTAAFAGSATATQKSFAERWILPYALVAVYGVVNEYAAKTTKMTQADFNSMLKALWLGTSSLNTHSKIGHDPLMLMVVESEPGYKIGALQSRIKITEKTVEDTAIRSHEHYKLDLYELMEAARKNKNVIRASVLQDSKLSCIDGETKGTVMDFLNNRGINANLLEI